MLNRFGIKNHHGNERQAVHHFIAAARGNLSRHGLLIALRERATSRASAFLALDRYRHDEWIRIIDEACKMHRADLEIDLLGGEPLLAPRVIEIATTVLDRGSRLTLFTNGVLPAEPVRSAGVFQLQKRGAEVRVGLAALPQQRCDALSGGERFDQLLLGLQNPELDPGRLRIDIMLFPDTVEDICQHLPALRRILPKATRFTLGLAFCGGRETVWSTQFA